jgi:hypothetical protein
MGKLTEKYTDVISVRIRYYKGKWFQPARYRATVAKKDGHTYWKFVDAKNIGCFTKEGGVVEAKKRAKALGLPFEEGITHAKWVFVEELRARNAKL